MHSTNHSMQSHPKFKAKFERDLKALYADKKYEEFIKGFRQYKKLNTPDDTLVIYYYESLMHERLYFIVVNYALERMHEGEGNYEDNTEYMLKAMLEDKRYEEIIDFSNHLMREDIPHRFRMMIQEIRQDATHAIEDTQRERLTKLKKKEVIDDLIDNETFIKYSDEHKLNFLKKIIEQETDSYRELVRDLIPSTSSNMVITMMLIYLKTIDDNESLEVSKDDHALTVTPRELPVLEETRLGGGVRQAVNDKIESQAPDLVDVMDAFVIGVLMQVYPFDPPFDDAELVNGFVNLGLEMVNIPHDYETDESVLEWIKKHM
ncbi:hypothetical protein [Aliicoccus persicus]|uniref:Uncharacterized protein n=1 Tax=Aliicoccus persicus TaxID=930138 RepID=A0A662Z2I7_9STAP|nr:hypothetical protein [Aliicoccus persicus]SEV82553.1 hypothetical protein SAMN05192557_0261 [Aliicoccus persicus]